MDYKTVLGIIAVAIGFAGFVPYFKDIFDGRSKPHVFSWFVWALLEGTAFFAQLTKGGGAGAWVTGVTAILCFLVFISALFRGEKRITRLDWASLIGALLGMALWAVTKSPLSAVILVSITDVFGFIPTFRKSYRHPYEETAKLYSASILKLIFALFALGSFNLTTALYPASLIITNSAFVTLVLIRRKTLTREN